MTADGVARRRRGSEPAAASMHEDRHRLTEEHAAGRDAPRRGEDRFWGRVATITFIEAAATIWAAFSGAPSQRPCT